MRRSSHTFFQVAIVLLFCASLKAAAQPNYPHSPKEAQLIFEDVDRFIAVYNGLTADSDTIQMLEENYFGKGSVGLKEYVGRHGLTASLLSKALQEYPEVYTDLAKGFSGLKSTYLKRYEEELTKYKNEISDAIFPPTYLLIGANRGIAQASQPGQLVTLERNWNNLERKLSTMIHELTHFQQARTIGFGEFSKMYSKENNMLDIILREGGAEFITYYIARKNTGNYSRLKYVNEHEQELKHRLRMDLKSQDKAFWLWESIEQEEVPILLGYTMGYKICEAYYLRAKDKNQAIQDILGITQPSDFLAKSGYFQ